MHCRISDKEIQYGTAGFRTRASDLDHVVYRMGMLAVLRSRYKNATIGVMITASHNPEEDNGVKLIDPDGEMLEGSWEVFATCLANVPDGEMQSTFDSIASETHTDMSVVGHVVAARDTRPSGCELLIALRDGVKAMNAHFTDFGELTTPQLHYIVRCLNSSCAYGKPTSAGYYEKLSLSFAQLYSAAISTCKYYKPVVSVDCANGVGSIALLELVKYLSTVNLKFDVYNDGSHGKLNHLCGADFVKVQQKPPEGLPMTRHSRCASFDGDADRIVYFYVDDTDSFRLLDGDKIATLFSGYVGQLVRQIGEPFLLGVVQTAYANGASTRFISDVLCMSVDCVPTGVKHLHHAALQFDIGVYFEANGHGTVLFKPSVISRLHEIVESTDKESTKSKAAQHLLLFIDLINQTVGDAISDMLVVELILASNDWDVDKWNQQYTDLPNRQLKITVKDRAVIQTTDAERRTTSPVGLQTSIDECVAKYAPDGRSFVRPSGTEDVVRVYAEAKTQADADWLAYEVGKIVHQLAGGVGDMPPQPPPK